MANVHDVAAYVLNQAGPMTAMKMQKLVYYSKAWHLVWDEKALFPEATEAWANGPVVRELYYQYQGQFQVEKATKGDPVLLSAAERASIDAVLEHYGSFSGHQLSELTHSEAPWRDARAGLPAGARSSVVIEESAMAEYYDSLTGSATSND